MDCSLPGSSAPGIFLERILLQWNLPDSGTESASPELVGAFFTISATWEAQQVISQSASGSVMSNSLQPHGLQPARLFYPWNFLGSNT